MEVVVGIDPGLKSTGYAVIKAAPRAGRHLQLIEAGLVETDPGQPLEKRLLTLYHGIQDLMEQHCPAVVSVEDLYTHYDYPQTAVLMGHARGVVLLAAAGVGAVVHHFAPARIKMALTGNGAATKQQVQQMVRHVLGLSRPPEPDHVADAIAVGLCYFYLTTNVALAGGGRRDR